MKQKNWYLYLSLSLILTSITIYAIQLAVFKDPKNTFFYIFQDLAFVPISVLLVTLVIDNLMKKREKNALIHKMNMVVGIFYSEMGNELMKHLVKIDQNAKTLKPLFTDQTDWSDKFIRHLKKTIQNYNANLTPNQENLDCLKTFLIDNRNCLMRMLENPNLLEHESFTDLLWAISHLTEELIYRSQDNVLDKDDCDHLAGDINRAYTQMLTQWITYMKHLRDDYPFMFKLARKTNAFRL